MPTCGCLALIALIASSSFEDAFGAQLNDSLCPDVFKYDAKPRDDGHWIGFITLSPHKDLEGVWIWLEFDRRIDVLLTWMGIALTDDNKSYTIKDIDKVLPGKTKVMVKIEVAFNKTATPPKLTNIRFNGRTICGTAPTTKRTRVGISTHIQTVAPFGTQILSPETNETQFFSNVFTNISQYIDTEECGARGVPLITFGFTSHMASWPWHIALFTYIEKDKTKVKTYICGGSLISKRHILTAGHCIHHHVNRRVLKKPEDFTVKLGITRLSAQNVGIESDVEKIYKHKYYNPTYLHNDIGLLKLKAVIEFNQFIRPICLWSAGTHKDVVGVIGSVAGWGLDENETYLDNLREVKMPVVDKEDCIYSNPGFFSRFTTKTSFCAGFANKSSVCNGDSGGGLVFNVKNDLNESIWEIRGIVSVSSPAKGKESICDPEQFTVFTDIAFYIDWINEKMKEG